MRSGFFLCCAALFTAGYAGAEMPTSARLTVDGSAYNVPLGKPFAIRLGGKRVTLQIEPQSQLQFAQAGVSFDYPAELKLSAADPSKGIQVWTLQGPSAAIMLQRYDDQIDPDSLREVLVDNLIERDGEPLNRQAIKLTGPERAYPGVQLRTARKAKGKSPATESVQNVITFANESGVFALMVQDVHAPSGEDSEEYQKALRLLGDTLKTGPEPKPAPAGETEPKPGT